MNFQHLLPNNHNKNNPKTNLLRYLTITFLLSFFFQNIKSTSAQITPDSTLGNENSIVTPNTEINGKLGDLIEGGATRGNNLFHSFSEFNINEGNAAYFANPTAIQNIFSRVTGGNPSHLFGTLGVLGNANLFLINPNGIFFGQNASLDIRGTFVGSTANELIFPDGNRFSAINPQGVPLLSIKVQPTIGLQIGNDAGSIINAADLNSDGTITLVGNSVVSRGNISAPQIEISAVGSENFLVELDTSGKIFNITNPNQNIFSSSSENAINSKNLQLSDTELLSLGISVNELGEVILNDSGLPIKSGNVIISPLDIDMGLQAEKAIIINSQRDFLLTNGVIDVTGNQGGSININAKNINISNSEILAGIGEELGFEGANSGDINLDVKEKIKVENSVITNDIKENALGNSGKILITAEDIIINNSGITTDILGKGNSGGVFLDTSNLLINNAGQISSNIEGEGKAGRIQINASEDITIDGKGSMSFSSRIVSEIKSGARGNTEGIEINTFNLSLINGGLIFTQTLGKGDAGDIKIKASEDITLDGETLIFVDGFIIFSFSGIASTSSSQTGGNSGTIEIDTSNLFLLNGGQISTNTNAKGNAGILQIKASENITIDGESKTISFPSGITSQITPPAEGNSGKIFINTTNLSLTNGGFISTSTLGKGNAGGVQINAKDIIIDGETSKGSPSSIFSQVNENAIGDGGSIFISALENINIQEKGSITVEARGNGKAGNINITSKRLSLNESDILAQTFSTDGGNIILDIPGLLTLKNGSNITATAGTAQAGGNGGNITITTPFIIAVPSENSDITANAFLGNGGNINITANAIFGLEERNQNTILSDITASSEFGLQGNININTAGIDPVRGLQDLPETEVNTEIAVGCQLGVQKDTSSFKIDGNGGFPSNPQQNLELDIFIDNGEINNFIQDWDSFNDSSPQNQSYRFFNNSSEIVNINEGIIFFSTNFSCN